MKRSWIRQVAACSLVLAQAPAWSLNLGMVDTFQGGVDGGWTAGGAIIIPPTVIPTGGPAGDGDGYLKIVSTGGSGAGSRLAVISGGQWLGNYPAAGVDGITMDLNNLGSSELSLRLWMAGPLGVSALTTAVSLPAGSGWQRVSFSLDAASMIGNPLATLASVQQLRLYHGTSAIFPGDPVVAQLGMDNVTAVPEPAAAGLLLAGLALLRAWRGRPARQNAGA